LSKTPKSGRFFSWIGGAAVVVIGGIWTATTYYVEHKEPQDKRGGTAVAVGQGFGSGGNTSVGGNVNVGPSAEQIAQIQKPLTAELAAERARNDYLTKLLLERNPAAGPGAQQAVGAAVQSIAQGAEEGDSRLEKALGLLKANKLAEATQLLSALAGDKEARAEKATAQAEKDRKEAATAYRNLGAIAGLADPKRALEAYEEAIALDPDDIESLYWAGAIQIDYGDLNKAQTRLARVQELAKADDQSFYKYAALGMLGDIKQQRGDLGGALQSYQGTIPIISRRAKSDPGNAGWQRDLSVSYNKVGDVLVEQGNLPEALKSYSDGLAIRDRLAKSDPGNAQWQYDLGISNERIGNVQRRRGILGRR
jgi:tetratricopeptide (TPR) repeat protein